jgi:hypothetical protein
MASSRDIAIAQLIISIVVAAILATVAQDIDWATYALAGAYLGGLLFDCFKSNKKENNQG